MELREILGEEAFDRLYRSLRTYARQVPGDLASESTEGRPKHFKGKSVKTLP